MSLSNAGQNPPPEATVPLTAAQVLDVRGKVVR